MYQVSQDSFKSLSQIFFEYRVNDNFVDSYQVCSNWVAIPVLYGIMGNHVKFWQVLNFFFTETTNHKSFMFGLESP